MFRIKPFNLNQIWQEFRSSLRQFIRARVANEQDAEDILQEVFIKIYSHLSDLREKNNLHSWIYQITKNTIIDFYRSQARNKDLLPFQDEMLQKNETSSSNHNKNEIVTMWLSELIQQLDTKYREALIYVELERNTQKALANKLGISLSGAKSRVQRGRKKLKNIILECCHLEFDQFGNILDYDINNENCTCRNV
ncbi:RNA polymerase sigma factor SigZ [Niallia sp. Krafla_26]|uniref:RNA polymerase sigma factor SigZ n=1 Tax=Niallia sp. Krafla_26 TaxID=3064703 RepID=UPI003D1759E4